MSADEATKTYAALAGEIFSKNNRKPTWKKKVFRASTLENAIKKIVADKMKKLDADQGIVDGLERMMDPRQEGKTCKV
jgi:hypothetical protein